MEEQQGRDPELAAGLAAGRGLAWGTSVAGSILAMVGAPVRGNLSMSLFLPLPSTLPKNQ